MLMMTLLGDERLKWRELSKEYFKPYILSIRVLGYDTVKIF